MNIFSIHISTLKVFFFTCSFLFFLSTNSLLAQAKSDLPDSYPTCTNLAEVQQKIGYPKDAAKQGVEGKVLVKILVDEEGEISKSEVLDGSPELLSASVEQHISELKFSAGRKDGKGVSAWITLPFLFKLDK